jgi:arylsulfatase A-like enzyme
MGDAFYRWDGFRYYASLLEFLPSVALVSILWSMIAVISTIIIWLLLNIISWTFGCVKLRVNSEHLLLTTGFLIFICLAVLSSKKLLWTDIQTTTAEKLIAFVSATLLSIFITWLLRSKAKHLIDIVSERITPLVWFFGIIVGLSFPLVTFYAVWNPASKVMFKEGTEFSEVDTERPNILLVTYDALTARDMSVYGYHRDTTPFISEWAKTATVFNKCQAESNTTSQTVASLMTGKRVWSHRRYQSDAGKPVKMDIESIPVLLRDSGYYNMAFIANDIASVKRMGMSDSFHVKPSSSETIEPASLYGFLNKKLVKYFGSKIKLHDWILKEDFILGIILHGNLIRYPYKTPYPPEKVFDMFLSEIESNYRAPYFAWIHLNPPHYPYLPPEEYMGMFDPSPKYRTAKSQYPLINPRYYTPEQQPDADIIRARYDEFIRYCDEQFKYFVEQLAGKDKFKNTVIIVSSDHGESFEHGYFTHGSHFLYEDMTHIPLIIKEPSQNEGRVIDFPVEQADIPATILDLAGIPVSSWMDGRSLGPALRGEEFQPVPVFSMSLELVHMRGQQEISKGVFAVWLNDYKLVYYPTNEMSLLFNLKFDPNEQTNLINSEAEVGQRLLGLIQDNINKVNKRLNGEKLYKMVN